MKKLISNVSLGSDPELFLQDKNTGELVSAEGYVEGSKHEPYNFDKSDKYAGISLDNVAAEFTIKPSYTPEEWETGFLKGLDYLSRILPSHLCTVAMPAGNFAEKYLATENAQRFGCEPDLCVWTRSTNEPPRSEDASLRSCGMHVHAGYDVPESMEEKVALDEKIVKSFDIFLGLPSVIMEPDNKRKELYGKAGAFRFKDYGIEYRTLSNYFMSSPELRRWVFENASKAIEFANSIDDMDEALSVDGTLIEKAINSNDKVLAKELCDKYSVPLI